MKKLLLILICLVGFLTLSSCRSTSNPCGLANDLTNQTNHQQFQLMVQKV